MLLLALASVALGLAWTALSPAPLHAKARTLYRSSPALTLEALPRIERVLDAVGGYLRAVDAALPAPLAGAVRHNAWGAYGSGFLAHNRVSNDLDMFVNVHLGVVRSADPERRDAAVRLLHRIDVYRRHAAELALLEQRPLLARYRFMEAVPEDSLTRHPALVDELAASLRLALAGKPYFVGLRHRGTTQLSEVDGGLAYLPLVTNATFFSNALEQQPGVFTGVRRVSLQFFFSADLKVEDAGAPALVRKLPLSPLAPPRQVAKLWQQAYSGVYANRASGELVTAARPRDKSAADLRLSYALGFLGSMSFEREVRRYPVKFLKRFHPWLDALGPTLAGAEHDAFANALADGLSGDAALFADQFKTEGEALGDLAGDPELLRIYSRSGDIARITSFFEQASGALRARHPELSAQLDAIDEQLSLLRSEPEQLREAGLSISDLGLTMVRKLSVDDTRMAVMWERAARAFAELGYQPVRAYATERNTIALHGDDLRCGSEPHGLLTELRRSFTSLHGGELVAIASDDARFAEPQALPRPYTLFVRCDKSLAEQERFLHTRQLLHAVQSELRILP